MPLSSFPTEGESIGEHLKYTWGSIQPCALQQGRNADILGTLNTVHIWLGQEKTGAKEYYQRARECHTSGGLEGGRPSLPLSLSFFPSLLPLSPPSLSLPCSFYLSPFSLSLLSFSFPLLLSLSVSLYLPLLHPLCVCMCYQGQSPGPCIYKLTTTELRP